MKIEFTCAKCSAKTPFTPGGRISVVCQKCGCSDVSFSHNVIVNEFNVIENTNKIIVKANEPFLGSTPLGLVWKVDLFSPLPESGDSSKA